MVDGRTVVAVYWFCSPPMFGTVSQAETEHMVQPDGMADDLSGKPMAVGRVNRAENLHRPTRRRERQMQCFKSSPQAQRFLSAHAFIYGHFHPQRHRMDADRYRTSRAMAFRVWQQETCAKMAA